MTPDREALLTMSETQKKVLDEWRGEWRGLVDRAVKIFMLAVPDGEGLTKEDYNPIKAWLADAVRILSDDSSVAAGYPGPRRCSKGNRCERGAKGGSECMTGLCSNVNHWNESFSAASAAPCGHTFDGKVISPCPICTAASEHAAPVERQEGGPTWDGGIVLRKPNWFCSFCRKDTGEMVYEWVPRGKSSGIGAHEKCFRSTPPASGSAVEEARAWLKIIWPSGYGDDWDVAEKVLDLARRLDEALAREQHMMRSGLWPDETARLKERAEAAEAKLPKWVRVSERLPEERQDVVIMQFGKPEMFRLCIVEHFKQPSRGITHWMPLPSPPAQEEGP